MKHAALIVLPVLAFTPLMAQEAPEPSASPTEQTLSPSKQDALKAALKEMAAAQSEDLYAAVEAIEETGGTEEDWLTLMTAEAEAGDPVAQLWAARRMLDCMVTRGSDPATDEDAKKAVQMLAAAAASGYVPAMVEQARLAGSGVGCKPDTKKGMQYLVEACKAGSVRARAAYLLVSGRLDNGNFERPEVASELKKNNYYLEEIIATLYGESPEATEWWKKASEHGSAKAAFVLSQSDDVSKTDEQAAAYLRLAVERHLPEALAAIGALETGGDGAVVPLNKEQGIRHLQEALMLGCLPAAVTLGSQYIQSPDRYSAQRVFTLYREAASRGDGRAMVAHAYCLATGRGCTADAAKGIDALQRLARGGMPYAYMALADLYFNGIGAEPDIQKAIDALGEAASAGLPRTYTLMAALTALGTPKTAPDTRRAELYLKMAEENGEPDSRALYNEIVADKGWHFLPPAE